jgi:hypothetical protein
VIDFEQAIKTLRGAGVRFVMVGDLPASVYGPVPGIQLLLEVCYGRSRDNIERLAKALEPLHPRLRDVA